MPARVCCVNRTFCCLCMVVLFTCFIQFGCYEKEAMCLMDSGIDIEVASSMLHSSGLVTLVQLWA